MTAAGGGRLRAAAVRAAAVLAGAALLAAGCGSGLGTVEGVLRIDGAPAAGAEVQFSAGERRHYGQSFEGGAYQMDPGAEGGMPPGEYQVTVIRHLTEQGEPLPAGERGEMLKVEGRAVRQSLRAPDQTVKPGENTIDLEVSSEQP